MRRGEIRRAAHLGGAGEDGADLILERERALVGEVERLVRDFEQRGCVAGE